MCLAEVNLTEVRTNVEYADLGVTWPGVTKSSCQSNEDEEEDLQTTLTYLGQFVRFIINAGMHF